VAENLKGEIEACPYTCNDGQNGVEYRIIAQHVCFFDTDVLY
jgi:hypothetical protein